MYVWAYAVVPLGSLNLISCPPGGLEQLSGMDIKTAGHLRLVLCILVYCVDNENVFSNDFPFDFLTDFPNASSNDYPGVFSLDCPKDFPKDFPEDVPRISPRISC